MCFPVRCLWVYCFLTDSKSFCKYGLHFVKAEMSALFSKIEIHDTFYGISSHGLSVFSVCIFSRCCCKTCSFAFYSAVFCLMIGRQLISESCSFVFLFAVFCLLPVIILMHSLPVPLCNLQCYQRIKLAHDILAYISFVGCFLLSEALLRVSSKIKMKAFLCICQLRAD